MLINLSFSEAIETIVDGKILEGIQQYEHIIVFGAGGSGDYE